MARGGRRAGEGAGRKDSGKMAMLVPERLKVRGAGARTLRRMMSTRSSLTSPWSWYLRIGTPTRAAGKATARC